MVATVDFNCVMEKLMRYTKNITETNVLEEKGKVRATINQVSAAKIVWKILVAEFHWPEFHSLLSDNWISDPKTLTKIVINNSRLLDWLFYGKSGKVVKHWFYEQIGPEWRWYRFEFGLMKGSIHSRGLVKLKSDPGLWNLNQLALKGHNAK